MSSGTLQNPVIQTLVTVASTSTTATSAAFTIPKADSYTFYCAVSAATGTTDIVFQTSVDGGTTYVNIPWRFAQITTTTGTLQLIVKSGMGQSEPAGVTGTGTLIAATGGALNLPAVVDPRFMKITYTITTGPVAFVLYCAAQPKGSSPGN